MAKLMKGSVTAVALSALTAISAACGSVSTPTPTPIQPLSAQIYGNDIGYACSKGSILGIKALNGPENEKTDISFKLINKDGEVVSWINGFSTPLAPDRPLTVGIYSSFHASTFAGPSFVGLTTYNLQPGTYEIHGTVTKGNENAATSGKVDIIDC